jgi:UPF0148 protein
VIGLSEDLEKMADWLRSGATMLTDSCPECSSPLFSVNDDIWCLKCNKKVIKAQEGEASTIIEKSILLEELEKNILTKLKDIQGRLSSEEDLEKIQQLGNLLLLLLELLEKTRNQLKSR